MNPASITSFLFLVSSLQPPAPPCSANHLSPFLANAKVVDLEPVFPQARGIFLDLFLAPGYAQHVLNGHCSGGWGEVVCLFFHPSPCSLPEGPSSPGLSEPKAAVFPSAFPGVCEREALVSVFWGHSDPLPAPPCSPSCLPFHGLLSFESLPR